MLQLRYRVQGIRFDNKRWTRDMDRRMRKLMKQAAWEWLRAVLEKDVGAPYTVGDNFPIQTGEAKGSLLRLAQLIQFPDPISASPPAEDSRYNDRRRRPDRVHIGRSRAKVFIGPTPVRLFYKFNFDVNIEHFSWNEQRKNTRVVSQTPWKYFPAGFRAFDKYLRDHAFEAVPKLEEYTLSYRIK